MTTEELKQEAEVFAKYYESLHSDDFETFYNAFLKVAEPREKRIAELEKENAELKDDNKVMADNYSKMEQKFYDNLAKAKKLLKQFLEAKNGEDTYKVEWEAENFLKESEVEK